MNKKEMIKIISHLPSDCSGPRPMIDKLTTLESIKLLDETQEVEIPMFVAEYIEFKKTYDFHVYGAMREIEDHYDKRVPDWFYENNIETFVRAWLDGYRIEKEPKYTVKIKSVNQYLVRNTDEDFLGFLSSKLRTYFTRKELEESGFGWVFDCPGVEIEEVTE